MRQKTDIQHNKTLHFAIMCDGYLFQKWQAEAIKLLLKNNIKLSLLIKNSSEQIKRKSFFKKLVTYPYQKAIFRIYNRFFFKPHSKVLVNLEKELRGTSVINCKTQKKGWSEYFSSEDIKQIKEYNPDFILRFGFNIIRGDILNVAKYGVWSFHHDDEQKYRGVPSCFREIFYNDNVNASILQRLTEKLDAGIILKKGYFKTVMHSYAANIDHLYFETAKWPLQICIDIENNVADYFNAEISKTNAPVRYTPNNFQMLLFLLKIMKHKFLFHYRELFMPEEWNIGVVDKPIQTFLQSDNNLKINWLSRPDKGNYFADPFAFSKADGTLNILCEHYNYKQRKANILSIEYVSGKFLKKNNKEVIKKSFHLSYPYIIKYKDTIYCIPESSENKKLDLYKYDNKDNFQYVKTLIDNIEAIDTILFEYQGLWWLFFTTKQESNTNLYAYYSKHFFGDYEPHKNNPVKIDIRSSRPGGTPFYYKGGLYRPSQDCSKTYGGKICINKILKLTPFEFKEIPEIIINPFKNTKYNKGVHTISSAGDYTLIDSKRFVFIFDNFKFQFIRKIKKIFGKH